MIPPFKLGLKCERIELNVSQKNNPESKQAYHCIIFVVAYLKLVDGNAAVAAIFDGGLRGPEREREKPI